MSSFIRAPADEVSLQIKALKTSLPNHELDAGPALYYAQEMSPKLRHPVWAKDIVVLVRPELLGHDYEEQVSTVLDALAKDRKFENKLAGTGPDHLRQYDRSVEFINRLCMQQPNSDFLVAWGQFGKDRRWEHLDVLSASREFADGETDLGVRDGIVMLLARPSGLDSNKNNSISFGGDRYWDPMYSKKLSGGNKSFDRVPGVRLFRMDKTELDSKPQGRAYAEYRHVTLWVPPNPQ